MMLLLHGDFYANVNYANFALYFLKTRGKLCSALPVREGRVCEGAL